ncbi:hypothetical protein V493_07380 [Pseudogymnoascus sp. VKM F-4281 (FW-2241)]|nr:hypothetical protein V493_07380 [Pseudogymnoascus sp. VKM F-4281 (FW-2241)]
MDLYPADDSPRDVLSQLNTTRPLFASYLRIRSLSPNPNSPEVTSARSELESSLSTLAEDLADLVSSVKAVETDPHRYGLQIEEVVRRKHLVDEVGNEVEDMREELLKHLSQAKSRNKPLPPGVDEEHAVGGDDMYEEFEQQEQQRIMNDQDQQLDGVFRTVGNLRQQADEMGRELEEQAEILEDVNSAADRVGGKLQTGLQKVGWVMRNNEETMSSCCIGVLIVVLIILLVLLLIL